jgi:anti-sigma factor RsiW
LNDYLDESVDPALRAELERHISECPNCWVVCDTTKKTIQVYKGIEAEPLPPQVHAKLMDVLKKHCGCGCHHPPAEPGA